MEQILHQILGEIKGFNKRFDNLESDMKTVKEDLKVVKEKQLAMENMLVSQGDHLQQLIKVVGHTNVELQEVKEELREIKKFQSRQQNVLESFSYLLVEHDGEIRALRRAL